MLDVTAVKSIQDWIDSNIKSAFEKLEGGSEEHINIPFARPYRVISYLEKCGYEERSGIDTNGWSWDYWIHYMKNNKVYCIAGDGYYQDACVVYFDEYETKKYLESKMSDALE